MTIRSVVVLCATVVALAVSTPVYAASAAVSSPVHAMFGKTKMVKLSLRNDTGAALELKAGEAVMKLAAGAKTDLKLPVGTRILANVATTHYQAGAVLVEVSSEMQDATIGIR